MKRTIWKYPLEITAKQVIEMPCDAQVLSLQLQDGSPCIWVLVSPDAPKWEFTVMTFGTGHSVSDMPMMHIGTYQLQDGRLAFHCFIEQKQQ